MKRTGWYLVTYDIANNRRLQRIHRYLKKYGVAAQKSVFFVQGTENRVNRRLDEVAKMMALKEDDMRAYPILHPSKVWSTGTNPMAQFPVIRFEPGRKKATKRVKKAQNKWLSFKFMPKM